MAGAGAAITTVHEYPYWVPSSDLHFNKEGKHDIPFLNDFPLRVKLVRLHYDHKLTPNYHDYLELTFVYDGRGLFRLRDRVYAIETGDLMVISPGELHTFTADYEKPLKLFSVFFLPELYYRPGQDNLDFELIRPILDKDTDEIDHLSNRIVSRFNIPDLFWSIYEDTQSISILGRIHAKHALTGLLIEILRIHNRIPISRRAKYEKKEKGSERLSMVFRLVNERFAEKLTLQEAADAACMSPNYFCRYFKRVTGTTFTEYVMRIRIDTAKKLLLSRKHSIKEIAYLVGLENISYFYRVFHRLTHLKPSEFLDKTEYSNSVESEKR